LKMILIVRFACATLDVGHPLIVLLSSHHQENEVLV
jgi:hypothetical protein